MITKILIFKSMKNAYLIQTKMKSEKSIEWFEPAPFGGPV